MPYGYKMCRLSLKQKAESGQSIQAKSNKDQPIDPRARNVFIQEQQGVAKVEVGFSWIRLL